MQTVSLWCNFLWQVLVFNIVEKDSLTLSSLVVVAVNQSFQTHNFHSIDKRNVVKHTGFRNAAFHIRLYVFGVKQCTIMLISSVDMTSNWEEYYSKTPKPNNYDQDVEQIRNFVAHHHENNRKIALVTSGGTTVPLEHNTVRFVDNFSAGGRGSASAEFFLDYGYVVIFLFRLKSLEPFVRHFTGCTFLDVLEIKTRNNSNNKIIQVKDDKVNDVLPVLQKYYKAKSSGVLISIPFTTLADYLWLLRACCECLSACEEKALLYLAAAVSDFYIPSEKLPIHKIHSNEGPLNISLQLVPKVLKPLVSSWVPKAFVVSFKLETDDRLLILKAREALKKYNHHLVIANILHTRKYKVTFVTKYDSYDIVLSPEELIKGIEIESKIINDLVNKHEEFLQAAYT